MWPIGPPAAAPTVSGSRAWGRLIDPRSPSPSHLSPSNELFFFEHSKARPFSLLQKTQIKPKKHTAWHTMGLFAAGGATGPAELADQQASQARRMGNISGDQSSVHPSLSVFTACPASQWDIVTVSMSPLFRARAPQKGRRVVCTTAQVPPPEIWI